MFACTKVSAALSIGKGLLDEKFEVFTFSPVGVSIYHLGNFGTARTKLKSWELKS